MRSKATQREAAACGQYRGEQSTRVADVGAYSHPTEKKLARYRGWPQQPLAFQRPGTGFRRRMRLGY